MLWLAVGHSVSAVPLQCPFCQHHPFLSQVSQPPPLFLLCLLASPQEALPKAPVPAGSAPVRPSASPQEALPNAFPLAPVPGGCAPVHPAVPPVAVSFHGHTSGTQTPAPCARPFTGPCPASDHAFPSASGLSKNLASSASPSVCAPARSPEGRAPCVVEIFAGSCNFSSTAVSMGFQSVAVDHVPAKRWHVLQLDLREPGAQQLLLSTLRCLLPALVVLAPPCGAASRARDIPAYSNGKHCAPAPFGPASRRFAFTSRP